MQTPEEIEIALGQLREVFMMAKAVGDKPVMDSVAFTIMALRWARGDAEAGHFADLLASMAMLDDALELANRHLVN